MDDIVQHACDVLEAAGLQVAEVRALPTGLGWQVRCVGGEMACAYKTGKIVAQGRNALVVKALFDTAPPAPKPARVARPARPAAPEPAPAAPGGVTAGVTSRFPPGWTTEPWDGESVPF